MALQPFPLSSFLFFLSLFLSSITEAHSAFSFIKNLEGSHKGSKAEGLLKLKKYLEDFGYLEYTNKAHHAKDDYFDDTLVSAVKTYQRNFRLNPTGVLDAKTVKTMMKARCGNPDIENGTNYMQSESHEDGQHSGPLRIVRHYEFPSGKPKWPASKYRLTYKYVTPMPKGYEAAVDRAYVSWAKVSKFTFAKVSSSSVSDCTIGFFTGDHGDKSPFAPGGSLAHGFHPTSGKLHYDASEKWVVGAVPYFYDVESVGAHEIGHNLGLSHSKVEDALMYPIIYSGVTKGLHADDIAGITELYK